MALALLFIVSFWQSSTEVTSVHLIDEPPRDLALLLDASPVGVGGALVHLATKKAIGAFSYETEKRVAVEMNVTLGPHTSHTPMELLGFLIGLRVYVPFCRRRQRIPIMKADSAAVLGSSLKLSSPQPSMNFIAAELSLLFEKEDIVTPRRHGRELRVSFSTAVI